jgi:hypothetical protein
MGTGGSPTKKREGDVVVSNEAPQPQEEEDIDDDIHSDIAVTVPTSPVAYTLQHQVEICHGKTTTTKSIGNQGILLAGTIANQSDCIVDCLFMMCHHHHQSTKHSPNNNNNNNSSKRYLVLHHPQLHQDLATKATAIDVPCGL